MSKDQATLLRALVDGAPEPTPVETEVASVVVSPTPVSVNAPARRPMCILQPHVTVEILGKEAPVAELSVASVEAVTANTPEPTLEKTAERTIVDEASVVAEVVAETPEGIEDVAVSEDASLVESAVESVPETAGVVETQVDLTTVSPLAEASEGIRIMAVCSGKGGVGKTNVVLNLAIELQRQGKRALIIDTDFGFTNIDVMCGLVAPYSLQNVLSGEKELRDIIVEGPEGVTIIPGGNDVVQLTDMCEAHKQVFEAQFSQLEDVDVLLIDMGAGVSKTALLYAMFAQDILLVVTPEPTSLTDAYSLLKTMEWSHFEKRVNVVVNRAAHEEEAHKTFKQLEATVNRYLEHIQLEYVSYIHDDRAVSAAVKAQMPFVMKSPESQPARDISRLAATLFFENQTKSRLTSMKQVLGRLMRVFG